MKDKIKPSKAMFIKLGRKGSWAKECFEKSVLKLSYKEVKHEDILADLTGSVSKAYSGKVPKTITSYANQIRHFYESDKSVLWITFHDQHLYWCFAKKEVVGIDNGEKEKMVIGEWSNKSIDGKPLLADNLSGNLLKTQGFQGTICNVDDLEYLVRKINGEELPEVIEVKEDLRRLEFSLAACIQKLMPKDFEVFIDLIFRQAGYLRTNSIGGVQKDKDIELIAPVTGERILVQVKSATNLKQFQDYEDRFEEIDSSESYDKFYYVFHSPKLNLQSNMEKLEVWNLDKVAELAVSSGLVPWILNKIN
ncbi:restriction endonuclease [Algoriphagus boritolerans]|uniref:Restriction endonuclease n=1 Tax=Algoriphagus boritolerans DSM 17298 = JCM 18970 TaxID=1120964 RepID=A0A1H5ZBR8_9BACT|nr:restriction endonuclease [Algoriphagus boritolerans]SEG33742.1 Restriction endonuclease [Algoriphagus boritolerans DSM 17298 = JCM 18970]